MKMLSKSSEMGGARLKFLIVILIIAIVAYAGFQFIPIAYEAYQVKDLMQHDVDTAVAIGKSAEWIKEQLVKSSAEYGIPQNAVITAQQDEKNRLEVRVQYTKPVAFPGYTYNYEFDHTARSSTFLTGTK